MSPLESGELIDSPAASPVQREGGLPRNLLESQATVLLCQNFLQCGILEVEGMGKANVYCFFLSKDVLLAQDMRQGQRFSDWLPQGAKVKINAKLIRENAKAPYLATTVWVESEDSRVSEEMTNRVFRDVESEVMEKYTNISSDLCWQLSKKEQDDGGIRLISEKDTTKNRDSSRAIKSPRTPRSPSPQRKHVAFQKDRSRSPSSRGGRTPRTPSPRRSHERDRKRSGRTPSPRRSKDRDQRKRNRSGDDHDRNSRDPSPKKRRPSASERLEPHTCWQPTDSKPYQAGLEEVFEPAYGVKAWVVRYETEELGVLRCEGGTDDVMFHVNQFWLSEGGSWLQFREVFPSAELAAKFPPKARLKCNIRKVNAGDISFQATAVWPEGKAPIEYRTKDWFDDLQRVASCVRNKVEIMGQLSSSSTREGVVQEFISFETGIIRMLDQDKAAAIFSLENVWVSADGQARPFSEADNQLLQDHIPVGSKLLVVVKPIPANRYSQLKYQAIIVWVGTRGERNMPKEFEERFNSRQRRIEMGQKLSRQHEMLKSVVRFNRYLSVPMKPDAAMIPIVLNLLPAGGEAVVRDFDTPDNRNIGLLLVTLPNPRDEQKSSFHVLFHLEDVIDEYGEPAFKDKNITVKSLMNSKVDLVARSIAAADSSSDLLRMTQKLNADYPDAKIPILQAVKVFRKSDDGQIFTGEASLPTFLRKEPKSFNAKQPATGFYMNISLKNNLDTKVVEFVESCRDLVRSALPNFFNPWYTMSSNKSLIKKEIPQKVLKNVSIVDTFGNSKHMYGEFLAASADPPTNPPQNLSNHPAKVCLIHMDRPKPRMGLLEFQIDSGGKKVKSYAFFNLKTVQCQQKSFGDLSKLLSVNMKEEISLNASLVKSTSKIPYVATSVWKTREGPPRKQGADINMLTDEWKKGTEAIIKIWMSRTIEMVKKADALESEETMRRAEKILAEAGGSRDRDDRGRPGFGRDRHGSGGRNERQDRPMSPPPQEPMEEKPTVWKWEPSLKDKVGTVQKVINNNYALAVSYQSQGWEEKRFFVLFDTCDVWINGEVVQKSGKGMKDVISENDSVKFHAVYVESSNEWNLTYLATAVIVNKNQNVVRDEQMPPRAILKDGCEELHPAKIQNFKAVAGKITKKTPPVDPNVQARLEEMKRRRDENDRKRAMERQKKEEDRRRIAIEQERQDRLAQKASEEAEKKSAARRRELMSGNPDLLRELQGMEIQRGTTKMYSCKLCGIQAMSLADAESHIFEDDHKALKAEKAKEEGATTKFLSREEAEEALFLNEFKEIKSSVVNGKKIYTCEKCKAMRLPMEHAKKHVLSLVHRNNHKQGENFAQLDQECKEMKKKGRVSTSYFCTPCGFTSDSVIATKNHIVEADHKKRTVNYCHACKLFSANRAKYQEHRFSIAHKRKMQELEKPYEEKKKEEKPKVKEDKSRDNKESNNSDKSEKVEEPKEPEDPLKCKVCAFDAETEDEMTEHKKSEGHRRKHYLLTGVMASDGQEDAIGERPFTSLEHMSMIHRAKDLHDKANKSKSIRIDEDVKKEKASIVEVLFKNGVFQKLGVETTIKCTTCSVKLQGQARKLNAQLFVHFVSDKHIQRLRVQVKGEDAGQKEGETVAQEEDVAAVEEGANQNDNREDIAAPEEAMGLPPPITVSVHQFLTDEEAVEMLKELEDITAPTPSLHNCSACCTGLMTAKFMMRHVDSAQHKNKTPGAPWRSLLDLNSVYEHGPGLFKCLYCNSGFLNIRQLELHVSTMEHKERVENCFGKVSVFEQNMPLDPPRCDTCDRYFASEVDMRCHMITKLHSIRTDQMHDLAVTAFTENNDLEMKLHALPAPALPVLPARLENQRGRIAAIFESGQFVVIEFSRNDCVVHALFDKSRVVNTDKSTFPVVGYPVIFHACKIEPEVDGVSQYLQFWASQVILGDGVRGERLGMEMTYNQLRREVGGVVDIGLEDCKAEMKTQLDIKLNGNLAVFFDEVPEQLEYETGIVEIKTASSILIKIQSSGHRALLILEATPLTELARERAEVDKSLEAGDQVYINAVLMDVTKQAQYLCTAVWKTESQPAVRRDRLQQSAVDMYHALVMALPILQEDLGDVLIPSFANMQGLMDMSGVIDMNKMLSMSGIVVPPMASQGYDDLAADDDIAADDDLAADDNIAADDDLAADDNIAADDDIAVDPSEERPKAGLGLKIASFAFK